MLRRTVSLTAALAALVLGSIAADRSPVQADVASTTPERVLDTRSGVGVSSAARLQPGRVLRLSLDGVPASGQTAVMLNVTAAGATARGYVSAWSCAEGEPATSVLNVDPGRATANGIILPYTSDGLCFSSSVPLHLIADLTGVATDGDVQVGESHRIHDSRGGAAHRAGRTYRVDVAGGPGVPNQAATALLNVTVARPAGDGWLIVEACGADSEASTMNFRAGEVVPHFTVSALGGGDVCITASVDVHVIVDTFGWTAGASPLQASTPSRVLDTRNGIGGTRGAVRDGQVVEVRIAGYPGVPNDAAGAIVNLVAVRPTSTGYVSVHPCRTRGDATSTINLWPGALRANQAVLTMPADGTLCVTTDIDGGGEVHLVLDAVGYVDGNVSRPTPPPTTQPTVPPTSQPTTPPPSSGARFQTLPVGAALPSGAECAARVRPAAEIRPENAAANANAGSRANANTSDAWSGFARVDGAFSGTTDEIIQWAACKWGIDEDLVRAQIVKESGWFMSAIGDGGQSFGLGQVRTTAHESAFQYGSVNARNSSAYNLDYTYASWRACYEGAYGWLNNVEQGRSYGAGDVWGCLGLWFSGRWYLNNDAYLNQSGDSVRHHYENRTWESAGFAAWEPPEPR